tara:strand:- start:3978 stop:4088 length:111 start_codon:yes stop_codon:yes gene_type:complete
MGGIAKYKVKAKNIRRLKSYIQLKEKKALLIVKDDK